MAISVLSTYVGAGYDGSVSIPGALGADYLLAIAGAFSDGDAALTASGWTKLGQIAGGGTGTGDNRAAVSVWWKAYAGAETFTPTLAGALNSYVATVYALDTDGATPEFTSDFEASTNVDPWSVSLSADSPRANSLAIAAATCWYRAPKASDATGTWTSVLGPGTQETGTNSEQRSWHKSVGAETVSTTITSTNSGFTDDDGGAALIIISPPDSGSSVTVGPVASEERSTGPTVAPGASSVSVGAVKSEERSPVGPTVATPPAAVTAPLGFFSPKAASQAWFSPLIQPLGWFSPSFVDFVASNPGVIVGPVKSEERTAGPSVSPGAVSIAPSAIKSEERTRGASVALGGGVKLFVMSNSIGDGYFGGGSHSDYCLVGSSGLTSLVPSSTLVDYAISGATTEILISGYSTNVLPYFDATKRNVIIFWETVNSLLIPKTPSDELDQLEAFAATARADGFEVLTATLLPIGYPGEDVAADQYNVLLRTSTAFDGIIDLRTALPQFSPVASNPLYDTDYDSHLSDGPTGGYAVSTAYFASWINGYLAGDETTTIAPVKSEEKAVGASVQAVFSITVGPVASEERTTGPTATAGPYSLAPGQLKPEERTLGASVATGPQNVTTAALGSEERTGPGPSVTYSLPVSLGPIGPEERSASVAVSTGSVTVSVSAVALEERTVGPLVANASSPALYPGSIPSEEKTLPPAASTGPVTVSPGAIKSEEQTLGPVALVSVSVSTAAVKPEERTLGASVSVGSPSVTLGPVSSEERTLGASVSTGPVTVSLAAVRSEERGVGASVVVVVGGADLTGPISVVVTLDELTVTVSLDAAPEITLEEVA